MSRTGFCAPLWFLSLTLVALGGTAALAAPTATAIARAPLMARVRGEGVALTLDFGGSRALGKTSSEYDAGFPLAATLGYQVDLGRVTLTPQAMFEMSRWSASDADAHGLMFVAAGGGQLSYWLQHAPLSLWTALHLGVGDVSVDGGGAGDSKTGLAMHVGWGLSYMVTSYLGAGLYMGVTKSLATTDGPSGALSFGFRLRAFYSLGGG